MMRRDQILDYGPQTVLPCAVFPYGSNCNPVQIDGELYLPTIMTKRLYLSIVSKCQDKWEWAMTPYLYMGGADQDGYYLLSADGQNPSSFSAKQRWFWRPVLVPLTKSRKPDSSLHQYSNGETVKMGTLFVSGDKVPCNIEFVKAMNETIPLEKLCFRDSDGQNDLEWLVWNGVLISALNLMKCTTDALADLHLATFFDMEEI